MSAETKAFALEGRSALKQEGQRERKKEELARQEQLRGQGLQGWGSQQML